jgi:hypothetical protein
MSGIFISYRREDSAGWTGRLSEHLRERFGPEWATVTDKSGKLRLEDPTDWVRTEIGTALKWKIRVIPVLVNGASVPTINLLLSCCRFQRHGVRCMNETGGGAWSDASLCASSKWRR